MKVSSGGTDCPLPHCSIKNRSKGELGQHLALQHKDYNIIPSLMTQTGLVERLRKEISSDDVVPLEREGSNASSNSNSVDPKIGDHKCHICSTKIGN